MSEEKPLTEVQEAEVVEATRQYTESRKFLRANPDFPTNDRNAKIMQGELQKRNLTWDVENLQKVYDEIDHEQFDTNDRGRPAAKELPPPPAPVVEQPTNYPWGLELTIDNDGPKRIAKMSGSEFRKFSTDQRHGREFTNQVNRLNLTRSDLKK